MLHHMASSLPACLPLQATMVFVIGAWVGVHRNPQELVANLRAMRRQVDINTEVSTWAMACCVAGRCASSQGGAWATGVLCNCNLYCGRGVEHLH